MADVTGMGQAQSTDKQVAQAGRARRAGRWMAEHAPVFDNKYKREKKARDEEEKVAREERVRFQTRKELEGGVNPNIDAKTTRGEYTHPFIRQLLDAVGRGQSRTAAATTDMIIREVMTDSRFINAIRNRDVPTPLEETDTEYAKEMGKRRETLANFLDMASKRSDYTLPKLSAHEMDIIISTAMGKASVWEGTDSQGRPKWPEGKPTPTEAVLKFLDSVAMREKPGSEGEFIGHVLKDLAGRTTLVPNVSDKAMHALVDGAYINRYLYQASATPIETAVEDFRKLVSGVLTTPTTELHKELAVPGIGYDTNYERSMKERMVRLAQVKAAQKRSAEEANVAKSSYDEVIEKKEQAKAVWNKVKPEDKARILDAERQTKEILDAAEQENAGLVKEAAKLEADIRKFKRESSPEMVTQEIVDHFRTVLVQGNETNDLSSIEAKLEPRLRNPVVAGLLTQTEELFLEKRESPRLATPEVASMLERVNRVLEERERLKPLLEGVNPRDRADIFGKEQRQLEADINDLRSSVAGSSLPADMKSSMDEVVDGLNNLGIPSGYVEAKVMKVFLDDKAARAEQMVQASNIPVETKLEILKSFNALRKAGFAQDAVKAEMEIIMKASAHPIGRAAALAVKKLNRSDYQNIVGITDAERIKARNIWEATSAELEGTGGRREGKWMRFKQWVGYHLFTVQAYKDKIGSIYDFTIKSDIEDIRWKNAFQKVTGKRPDGTPYKTRVPRLVGGMASLGVKGYLGWATFVFMTHQASFSEHFLARGPWKWWYPATRPPSEVVRVISDNENNVQELTNRPTSFYRMHYGLGNRLQSEQNDQGVTARLDWVKRHPDVLKFLQERRTLREVISYEEMPHNMRNPDMCSTSQRRIPQTCNDLGLNDAQAVQSYEFVEHPDDGWRAEVEQMRVCCFVRTTTRPVSDGLMINRSQSDRFVDQLQAAERGGARIDSAYMRNPANRGRWVQEWFLITPNENTIMETFRIMDRDNVQFILSQGSKVSNTLLPRCGERGESTELIQPDHRDAFVMLWRDEVRRQYPNHNPTVEDVPTDILTASFNAVRTTALNNHWIEDTTLEHNRRETRREYQLLNLQTDTAVDALLAQPDLRDFVHMFASTNSTFRIDPNRSDEFINNVLLPHKLSGGSFNDFNPYADTWGSRVQWAIGNGYMNRAEQFQNTQNRQGSASPDASTSAQTVQAPPPIPDLTPEGERFYANQSNEFFRTFVETVMTQLYEDTRADGHIMADVLRTRFGANRERMDRAIKSQVYRLLTSTGERDAALRSGYGISVTGTNDSMVVAMGNPRLTRTSMRNYILQFVREQGAIATPPRH